MLVLAQVQVEARDEGAAEHGVQRLDGDLVRVRFGRGGLAGEDDGLLGARPVEEVDLGAGPRRTAPRFFFGTSPAFQDANSRSSRGWISARVVSPTTTSVALLGLNQVSWNRTTSSRVSFETDCAVPEPVSGVP